MNGSVLITGTSGFIGTNLVRHLQRNFHWTIIACSRSKTFDNITYVDNLTPDVIDAHQVKAVVHLAGIAHDLSGKYRASDYFNVNTNYTMRVFDCFVRSRATKFIYMSSIKAAFDSSSIPLDESVEPCPTSAYGRSKWKAEQYLTSAALTCEKRCYIFRPCMVHGPGNKGNLNLLYRFVKLGLPYPLGAFENRRSFLNITNLNHVICEFLNFNKPSGLYHLADDDTLSTVELYRLISAMAGRKPVVLKIPKPMIESVAFLTGKMDWVDKLTGDMIVSNKKVSSVLENPLPISLREGLAQTIISF
jgi:nucleoside-diphosphate-sugar epimerase